MKPAVVATLALVAVLLAGEAAAADRFGRLFFSPEERERIDHPPPALAAPAPPPPALRVDGVVRSSSGAATIWINGSPTRTDRARVDPSGDAARIAGSEGGSVAVRVGETYRPDTGARETALPRVEIHRPASAR